MATKKKIYVSSTFVDLEAHRAALKLALERAQYDVECMEKYPAFDRRPLDKCLDDVAACDAYVLLLAHRYGHQPKDDNPEAKSITRLEYEHASACGKPCLVFCINAKYPWVPEHIDKGKTATKLAAFRKLVQRDRGVRDFTSPDDLANQVQQALKALDIEQQSAVTVTPSTPPTSGHPPGTSAPTWPTSARCSSAATGCSTTSPPGRRHLIHARC